MAQFYVPQSANITMADGSVKTLRAGMIDEVAYPQDLRDHPYVKNLGIKPEADMTDDDRFALSQMGVNGLVGVMDNRPQSDVNLTDAVDARALVSGVTDVADPEPVAPIVPAKPVAAADPKVVADAKASEVKAAEKPSTIPGPKPGQ